MDAIHCVPTDWSTQKYFQVSTDGDNFEKVMVQFKELIFDAIKQIVCLIFRAIFWCKSHRNSRDMTILVLLKTIKYKGNCILFLNIS